MSDFEKWKLCRLLNQVINKQDNLPYAIKEFYELYCHGCYFLQKLGLVYGLQIEVPHNDFKSDSDSDSWNELTSDEQKQIIGSFYPNIIEDCKVAVEWLENEKIVLTGEEPEYNEKGYIDNRSEQEKEESEF